MATIQTSFVTLDDIMVQLCRGHTLSPQRSKQREREGELNWPRSVPIYQINLSQAPIPFLDPMMMMIANGFCLTARSLVRSLGCRWLYFPPLISSDPTQEIRATIHSETTQCIAALMAFLLCLITTADRGRRRAAIKSFPPNYHPFQQNCVSKARTHNGYYDMALGYSNNVSGQRR